jgi:hypothetical protein
MATKDCVWELASTHPDMESVPDLHGTAQVFIRRSVMAFPIARFGKKWEMLSLNYLRLIRFRTLRGPLHAHSFVWVACITGKTIFAL